MKMEGLYRAMIPLSRDSKYGGTCVFVMGGLTDIGNSVYEIKGYLLGKDSEGKYVISYDEEITNKVKLGQVGKYTNMYDAEGVMIFENDYLGIPNEYSEISLDNIFFVERCVDGITILNSMGVFSKLTEDIIKEKGLVVIGDCYQDPELYLTRGGTNYDDFMGNI